MYRDSNNSIILDANTSGFNMQIINPNTSRIRVQFASAGTIVTKYITLSDS